MNLAFLKKKKVYIPTAIVIVIIALIAWGSYQAQNKPIQYETANATRQNLVQSVDATGQIESSNALALRFELGGTLDVVNVKEGDKVKAGDVLANLRLADLNAAVWQASANLQQKLAGATEQDRTYYKAAMDAAQAALEQSKIDVQNNITVKEAAMQTAEKNLKLAEGGDNSQIVQSAYNDSVALLFKTLSVLDDSLSQSDYILGIDNKFANDSFENVLSLVNTSKLNTANMDYTAAKNAITDAKAKISPLSLSSSHNDIDKAVDTALQASLESNQLLMSVVDVLNATLPEGSLTQADLQNKKATIENARTSLNANYTSLIKQKQANADAETGYDTYKIAYAKAVRDWEDAKSTAATTVATKEAAYNQAVSNYQTKILPPREVDVAYYRAALAQASANRDKAILKAPIDGVVTKVNKKKGEMVSQADATIEMLAPHYEIKVDIPETDVPKIKLGDTAEVTLDAFGDDTKFTGKIISIDPASTEVQDVVYYRVRVSLDDTDRPIKPGMTANVKITTAKADNVIFAPTRAIRTRDDGGKYIRVLVNNKEQERNVQVGLKADDGKTEIQSGLNEGDVVIVSVKTTK